MEMARFLTAIYLLIIVTGFLICDTTASVCSLDNDCLHFEHCCKGNCTSKRFECEHICSHDSECSSNHRCMLGLCVNCTDQFSCDFKGCINDSHCPGTHSCMDQQCALKKKSDLTAEMLPFIIFITALSVSLLIVCYNDYILERLGHRGCMECMENRICNCSLFLKIWMWRHQRLQQRQQRNTELTPPCPVEVRFDSRIVSPPNSSNEKRETGFFWSIETFKSRFMFWRRLRGNSQSNNRSNESNDAEETRENSSTEMVSSVVLLNEFMNTNEVVTGTSTSEGTLSGSSSASGTSENTTVSIHDQSKNSKRATKTLTVPKVDSGGATGTSSHLENDDVNVNRSTIETTTTSIKTASHFVTIV